MTSMPPGRPPTQPQDRRSTGGPSPAQQGARPAGGRPGSGGRPQGVPHEPPELRDPDAAAAAILARNSFQRDRYYFMVRVTMALAGLCLFLGIGLVVLALHRPQPMVLVENQNGRVVPVTPLNTTVDSLSTVEVWMEHAVVAANTYNFANYKEALAGPDGAERFFTVEGWNGWLTALEQSGNLAAVKERKMVASASPAGGPVLVKEGVEDGVYTWQFQLPVVLTYQVLNRAQNQHVTLLVTVVRAAIAKHPSGLAIKSITFASGGL